MDPDEKESYTLNQLAAAAAVIVSAATDYLTARQQTHVLCTISAKKRLEILFTTTNWNISFVRRKELYIFKRELNCF